MSIVQTQPELLVSESSEEVDNRLQKRMEEIYIQGSTMAEFFRKLRERATESEELKDKTALLEGALLFQRGERAQHGD